MRASGPLVPRPTGSPYIGDPEITPRVGLKPTRPQQLAGIRIEPPPSDPWASGTSPPATAVAAPPLDPPAIRLVSYGVTAGGAITSGSGSV